MQFVFVQLLPQHVFASVGESLYRRSREVGRFVRRAPWKSADLYNIYVRYFAFVPKRSPEIWAPIWAHFEFKLGPSWHTFGALWANALGRFMALRLGPTYSKGPDIWCPFWARVRANTWVHICVLYSVTQTTQQVIHKHHPFGLAGCVIIIYV
jgi:hypothetical protein